MTTHWKGRVCLVTGGAGFGGAHLVEQLMQREAIVHVLDRVYPRQSYLGISGLEGKVGIITGDIRDTDFVKIILERFEIDTVFHLAAQPIVPMSNSLPLETLSINSMGTYSMLEAVRVAKCPKRFVFASSAAYYGTTSTDRAISEDDPPLPAANIYSPSKVAADVAVRAYAAVYGLKAVACRFINTYGPGDTNFSRIVPKAVRSIVLNTPYDFGDRDDGTTCLDYMHIRDMASAYICVAEQLDTVAGHAFNFGTGLTTSNRDLVKKISVVYDGRDREPAFSGPHREQPLIKRLDVSKAKAKLGWQASTPLDEGLTETIRWYQRYWDQL